MADENSCRILIYESSTDEGQIILREAAEEIKDEYKGTANMDVYVSRHEGVTQYLIVLCGGSVDLPWPPRTAEYQTFNRSFTYMPSLSTKDSTPVS
jgi:hypothetical protein